MKKAVIQEKLNFKKMGGLLPIIIQDYYNNEVLMLGFMNEDAWKLTLKTKKVHYWSRKKKRLWMKGEESGHIQIVKEIYLDNDNDTLLIKVQQIGGAVEDGYRSCFFKMRQRGGFRIVGQKIFDPQKVYENYSERITFVLPAGSLYATTIMLFNLAGYQMELRGNRSFKPEMRHEENIKLVVARSQEIPGFIESGRVDMGITGIDLIEEYGVSITNLGDLGYNENGLGKIHWVLAVPKEHRLNYKTLKDFSKKKISTEIPHITKQYFTERGIYPTIQSSVGTTESKAPFFSDAIVDICETGTSLKQNGLIPLYILKSSTAHVFANNNSLGYGWKRRKIEEIAERLKKASKKLPKNQKLFVKLPSN